MSFEPPAPAASAAPAAWIGPRIDFRSGNWVSMTVGAGFDAYARILHPVGDGPDAPRWADVAAENHCAMRPTVQWEHVTGVGRSEGRGYPGAPQIGTLNRTALRALCDLLARHTSTPDQCWFAVWDGWGWQHPGAHAVCRAASWDCQSRSTTHPRTGNST